MLPIEKKLIKYNFSKRTDKIKYIVIHTTGNTSKGAGVENHFKYFNGGNRGSSADYFVDDKAIGQFVNDYNYSWHCGDGKGKYGITNNNSIGVEICVNSDGDYNKTINNTIDLVKYLMGKYNISISNVVRHYDASRKNCPKEILEGKNNITWDKFKSMILNNDVSNSNKPQESKEIYRVRKAWNDIKSQIGAYSELENAKKLVDENKGYFVFNSNGEKIYPISNSNNQGGSYMSRVYKNGSTREDVYSDERLSNKIGSLDPYEQCEAIADINGKIVVLYKTANGKKVGFVKYRAGL